MAVPFIGRLNVPEYTALVSSFFLVILEIVVRILTLALPNSLLSLFYRASRQLFDRFNSPAQQQAQERQKSISTSIRDAADFVELCSIFGYTAEEHVFQTKDGYLLGLHRLAWRPGEEDQKVNAGPNSVKKRVVYMHHGLLMNSEVWVCNTESRRSLAFVLVERGFDVWFGNNRGNKYSKKSVKASAKDAEFWNFSIDEFALYDIPDSIAYILDTTGQPSLSYIGFSQGTAQAFASLAIHPKLNYQINVFIGLAPAMSPAGLSNGIVDALVKASPQIVFLLFGRRSILSSATMWQSILYPPLFVSVIDYGMSFLFGWRTQNMSLSQKLAAYTHLYSYTSTKSVVHWFQIIRTKSFQMYDDDVHPLLATNSKHTKVAKYPTRNIKTPIVLVYGGSDSLVDIKAMLRELPAQTVATEVPHYEHLDFLWARDTDTQVFQHVFDALDSFTDAEHTKEEFARYRVAHHQSVSAGAGSSRVILPGGSGGSGHNSDTGSMPSSPQKTTETTVAVQTVQTPPPPRSDDGLVDDDATWSAPATPPPPEPVVHRHQHHHHTATPTANNTTTTPAAKTSPTATTPPPRDKQSPGSATASGRQSPFDALAAPKSCKPCPRAMVPTRIGSTPKTPPSRNPATSPKLRIGKGGSIRVGSSKAVGGISTEAAVGSQTAVVSSAASITSNRSSR